MRSVSVPNPREHILYLYKAMHLLLSTLLRYHVSDVIEVFEAI